MKQQKILRKKIETRIARKHDNVFLTREFIDLAGRNQVLRVLHGLVGGTGIEPVTPAV